MVLKFLAIKATIFDLHILKSLTPIQCLVLKYKSKAEIYAPFMHAFSEPAGPNHGSFFKRNAMNCILIRNFPIQKWKCMSQKVETACGNDFKDTPPVLFQLAEKNVLKWWPIIVLTVWRGFFSSSSLFPEVKITLVSTFVAIISFVILFVQSSVKDS